MTPRTFSSAGGGAAGRSTAARPGLVRGDAADDDRATPADGTHAPAEPSDGTHPPNGTHAPAGSSHGTHGPSRASDSAHAPAAPSDGKHGPASTDEGTEPDTRFTFANERTFLAWSRTALALVVAGLAISQLLPPFPGVPLGRHLLAVPLIGLGAVLSVISYLDWGRNQQAMRRGEPLPRSRLPRILAASIAVMAIAAAVMVLVSAALR